MRISNHLQKVMSHFPSGHRNNKLPSWYKCISERNLQLLTCMSHVGTHVSTAKFRQPGMHGTGQVSDIMHYQMVPIPA